MQIRNASPLKVSWRRYVKNNSLTFVWASLGYALLFYASLLTLYSLILSMNTEDSYWPGTSIHTESSASGATGTLWVFVPLMGLKYARRRGMHSDQQHRGFLNTVPKERVTVQGWGLVAEAIRTLRSDETFAPFAAVRIIGLVGHPLDCDPWLNTHTIGDYECLSLPSQCLSREFYEVPTVDCIFKTILHRVALHHNDNDVIIYANGDLVFPASKLLAVLSFVYCDQDTSNKKDAILVGQRRDTPFMDDDCTDGNMLLEDGLLTVDNFQHFFHQALTTSDLHADFGVDYFILPTRKLSSLISIQGFPPFLVGRYRWDNALLASFILDEIAFSGSKIDSNVSIRTIDITSVLPVVHLGQHSASPDYFQAQLGADYNNRVAHEHFGDSCMLGRIHNTNWILTEELPVIDAQGIPSPVFDIVKRGNKVDADLLKAFSRAYRHPRPSMRKGYSPSYGIMSRGDPDGTFLNERSYPVLLLMTVLPRDVPYAKLWMQHVHSQNKSSVTSSTQMHNHFLFVTVDQDSYNELEAAFPGTVILEKAFAWSTSAAKWYSFSRLLRNRLTVGVMSARALAVMSNGDYCPLLWQHTLSGECDAVVYQRENHKSEDKAYRKGWDIFSVRPSPTGMFFWDEYQQHGQGSDEEETDPRSLFAQIQQRNVCVVDLYGMRHVMKEAIHPK